MHIQKKIGTYNLVDKINNKDVAEFYYNFIEKDK